MFGMREWIEVASGEYGAMGYVFDSTLVFSDDECLMMIIDVDNRCNPEEWTLDNSRKA